ncbi:MAG: peptidoglycan-associated lipoprotein Pal [Vicinamibacterales bacterium]
MTISLLRRTVGVATVCVVLGLGAAACAKKAPAPAPPPPPPPAAPATPPPPPPPPPPPAAPAPRPLTEDELFAQKSLDQLNSERPLGDVYFDLDESSIRDDARAALATNATWLKRWTNTRISIEGHCDERGTAEYNLGLGERRASAVKAYLVELGVPADRVVIVSKGKESPFCTESNEACWQQNRRGHFIITAK